MVSIAHFVNIHISLRERPPLNRPTFNSGFSLGIGETLLLLSLTLDGVTGAIQDRMRAESSTKPYPMMLKMNLWSIAVLGAAVLLTGELFEFVAFVSRHPDIIKHLASFSLTSALGQNFIFMTISHFGPLVCSLVTTTRKFFTILGKNQYCTKVH